MELSDERLAKILALAEDGVAASVEDTRLLALELIRAREVIECWSETSARVCETLNQAAIANPDTPTETGVRVAKLMEDAAEQSLRLLGT